MLDLWINPRLPLVLFICFIVEQKSYYSYIRHALCSVLQALWCVLFAVCYLDDGPKSLLLVRCLKCTNLPLNDFNCESENNNQG